MMSVTDTLCRMRHDAGYCCELCSSRIISIRLALTRKITTNGVLLITSSRVPRLRPMRPKPGCSINWATCVLIKSPCVRPPRGCPGRCKQSARPGWQGLSATIAGSRSAPGTLDQLGSLFSPTLVGILIRHPLGVRVVGLLDSFCHLGPKLLFVSRRRVGLAHSFGCVRALGCWLYRGWVKLSCVRLEFLDADCFEVTGQRLELPKNADCASLGC